MESLLKSISDFASGAPVSDFSFGSIRLWLIEEVDQHYLLALAAFALVGVYILMSVFKAARNFRQDWNGITEKRFGRIVAGVLLALAIALSLITTENIRQTGIPVPTSIEKTEIVLKEEKVLQWQPVKAGPGEKVWYQVQWSEDPSFPKAGTDVFDTDETVALVKPRRENIVLYWRVRAALVRESGRLPRYGRWTEPAQIDHFKNVLERIHYTRRLRVGVDRSFGRSFMRFLKPVGEVWDGSYAERGLEPELAYQIALALCRHLLENNDSRDAGCVPSHDRLTRDTRCAAGRNCPRVEVEFVALEGKEAVLEAVGRGDVDLTLSSFVEKPDRVMRHHIQFSKQSYYEARIAMLYSPSEPSPKLDDIANAVIGVEDKTAVSACMREYMRKHSGGKEWADRVITVTPVHGAPKMLENSVGPRFIFTNTPYALGWTQRYNVKCLTLPREMFAGKDGDAGEQYPDYCRGLKYRVAARLGETKLLDIVDGVIKDETEQRTSAIDGGVRRLAQIDYNKYMGGAEEAQCPEALAP